MIALFGIIIYVTTDNGTVKITGTDDRMTVTVDGRDIRIENLGKPIAIRVGTHHLLVKRDGLTVKTDTFEIERGREKVLEVRYTPQAAKADPKPGRPAAASPEPGPASPPESNPPTTSAPADSSSPLPEPEYVTTVAGRIKLKLIPAGEFMMGSNGRQATTADQRPPHRVVITRPFYLGVTEVTQGQYEAVTGQNPSFFSLNGGGKDKVAGSSTKAHPVESVSWLDAVSFCNKLSEKEGLKPFYRIDGENVTVLSWSSDGYRLPTEGEWEFASCGDPGDLAASAWYYQNSAMVTRPVGQKQANRLGLSDMLGNVWEWCWDAYDAGYYALSPSEDPRGPSGAELRVRRGGSWGDFPGFCQSACRNGLVPVYRSSALGFRVARGQSQRSEPKVISREEGPASTAVAKSPPPVRPVSPTPRSEPQEITTVAGQIKMRLIPAGEFMMGSDDSDPDASDDEVVLKDGKKHKHLVRSPGLFIWASPR